MIVENYLHQNVISMNIHYHSIYSYIDTITVHGDGCQNKFFFFVAQFFVNYFLNDGTSRYIINIYPTKTPTKCIRVYNIGIKQENM